MLLIMSTTTIRVTKPTRDMLNRLAAQRGETLTETVSRGVRLLQQEQLGIDLARPLESEEQEWLDADFG